jgi:hypothetical protein
MMMKHNIDPTSVEGLAESPYLESTGALRVSLHSPRTAIPVLWWRSVGNTHTAFAMECMIDEAAHAVGQDPLAYRMALLKEKPRHAAALSLAADKAGWNSPPPAGRARGLAVHESFGSIVAECAEVSVEDGRLGLVSPRLVGCRMRLSFNTAGPCIPGEHYMLPPERCLGPPLELIEERKYFTLHAGRQTGKTMSPTLNKRPVYSRKRFNLLGREGCCTGAQTTLPDHVATAMTEPKVTNDRATSANRLDSPPPRTHVVSHPPADATRTRDALPASGQRTRPAPCAANHSPRPRPKNT